MFPQVRLRRLRYNPAVRELIRAVELSPRQFVMPLFVRDGDEPRREIAAMPGQFQLSIKALVEEVRELQSLGVGGVMLFGIPPKKDSTGSDATSAHGIIPRAVEAVKSALPEALIISDVCFCEYTDHGHCGPINDETGRMDVDNDATLELLAKQALAHAKSGVDLVAPSGMMDGMIVTMRRALDEGGYSHLPIMSYSAKYASAFYGPFREAAESAPQFGDRKSYQMDPASDVGQAMREIELDVAEGADMIMVKPALAYLDVIRAASERFAGLPLAAYQVSGEYSMIKAAAQNGWIDEKRIALESLTSIRRAGAAIILTYYAKEAARWLQ